MVGVCVCDVCVHTARALPAHSLRCMGTCTHMHAPLSSLRCVCCLYQRCTNLSIYIYIYMYMYVYTNLYPSAQGSFLLLPTGTTGCSCPHRCRH